MAEPQLVSLTWSIHPETNEVQSITVSGRIPLVDGAITEYVKRHKQVEKAELPPVAQTVVQDVADKLLAWMIAKRAEERSNGE